MGTTISFDPFLSTTNPFGRAGAIGTAEATMWLASAGGKALGYVEKAGPGRYSAHTRNTFFGPFATREAAGQKLYEFAREKAS